MRTQHIIPAIIPDSLDHLQSRLKEIHGSVKRVQIDVMNGTYAPTTSWPYVGTEREVFEAVRRHDQGLPYWQDFEFEVDLLVQNPEEMIVNWALAGAACLIIHTESTKKLKEIQKECYERRLEMALALKPSTDIAVLEPYVEQALFVQVMGSDRIGYHGVTLEEGVVEKIREIHKRWPQVTIGVDIGVNAETIPELCKAGARRFAAGSAVFNFGSPEGAVAHLEDIVSKHIKQ